VPEGVLRQEYISYVYCRYRHFSLGLGCFFEGGAGGVASATYCTVRIRRRVEAGFRIGRFAIMSEKRLMFFDMHALERNPPRKRPRQMTLKPNLKSLVCFPSELAERLQ
jgi:hypothetical protein